MIMGSLITSSPCRGNACPAGGEVKASPLGERLTIHPQSGEKRRSRRVRPGNPVAQSGVGRGRRLHVCSVVRLHTPTRSIGWGHKGTEKGGAVLQPPQSPPQETRRSVGSCTPRHTAMRNGGTLWRSQQGGGVNQRRPGGGMPHEAHAAGKASGEAEVGTVVGR